MNRYHREKAAAKAASFRVIDEPPAKAESRARRRKLVTS